MNTHDGMAEIKSQLTDAEKSLSEIFKNKVERLCTSEVKERFKHFVETEVFKIEQEIRHCLKIIDSPVFVGLLGRYSHGKTALVNSLFSLDSEYCLVEGEGVVTSKITRVEFAEDLAQPKFFECYRNGEQSSIDIATLQANVSGKVAEDSSTVDYYFLKLPAVKPFAQVFERKLINLIDMPGLGGPYFKDTEKTKKYIEHLDMLLVVLKISEIDQASRVIEPYIAGMINKNIPMIPVITFFDKWRENPKFTDCASDEDAIEKARKEINTCIPSLARHMTRMIAVSAKNGFQIENLRELILKFVEAQNFAIGKIRKENSDVFKRKIREIQKNLENLIFKSEKSIEILRRNIETILPERGELQSFSKHFGRQEDKLLRDGKLKISRATKDVLSNIKDKANNIRHSSSYADIDTEIKKIENDLNRGSIKDLQDSVNLIFLDAKERLEDSLEKYIDKLELSPETKDVLREQSTEIIKDGEIFMKDLSYKSPDISSNMVSDYSKTVFEVVIGLAKTPQFLVPMVIGLLLISVPIFSSVREFGWIIILGNIVVSLFLDNSVKKKNFNESKNQIMDKLSGSLDRQKLEEEAYRTLAGSIKGMLEEVDEILGDDINKYGKDLRVIKEASKEFKAKIQLLSKTLSREIEKLEVSEI